LLGCAFRCAWQRIGNSDDIRTRCAKAGGMVFHHPSGTDYSYFE
jgi:hypothetical protein